MTRKPKINVVYLGVFLAVTGGLSAGLLAVTSKITEKPIDNAKLRKTNQALQEVLPKFNNIPADDKITVTAENGTIVTFYAAKDNGKITGIAGEGCSARGFAGKIMVMAGMDAEGKITKVLVTEQKETPGLGTVVTDRVRERSIFDLFSSAPADDGLPPNKLLDAFDGHSTEPGSAPWKVSKDGGQFEFITGATVTSRAVTDAVYTVSSTFSANREAILSKLGSKPDDTPGN